MLKGFPGCGTFDAETRKVLPSPGLCVFNSIDHYDRDENLKSSEGQNEFFGKMYADSLNKIL